jgi:hypothetical protein
MRWPKMLAIADGNLRERRHARLPLQLPGLGGQSPDIKAENLTRKCIELALGGDTVALRFCLERIYLPRKDRPVTFPLPPITSARDAADVMGAVAEAVAAGRITPSDAAESMPS